MKESKFALPKELTPFLIAKKDFTIDRSALLGGGPTSCVYEGIYQEKVVAVKLFSLRDSELTQKERWDYSQQTVHEAKMLSEFKSDHIVRLRGITYLYCHYTLVMEKAAHFQPHLKQTNASLKQQLSWALQITLALQEVHAKDIIHRDLRLNNILIDSKDQAKLMDFGIAVKLGSSGELKEESQYFRDYCQCQPYHTAPEIHRGFLFSKSSDIYSLGTLFCELLYPREYLTMVLGDSQTLPGSCPLAFKEIISACWHPNSGLRPSAQQVRICLQKALQNLDQPVKLTKQPKKSISPLKICASIAKSFSFFAQLSVIKPDVSSHNLIKS